MQVLGSGKMLAIVGAVFALGVSAPADAARQASKHAGHPGGPSASSAHAARGGHMKAGAVRVGSVRFVVAHGGGRKTSRYQAPVDYADAGSIEGSGYGSGATYSYGGMSCVPFARDNSGIELAGNAGTWWDHAAGVYQRGAKPELGSVLNFRSTGRMRMGHVAIVPTVINGRVLEIDHANWDARGRISRGVRVVDVSEGNDWSAVRVALGSGDYGSVYPTYGFIYDRPDRGTMIANTRSEPTTVLASAAAPAPAQPALRTAVLRVTTPAEEFEELAEAPDEAAPHSYRGRGRYAARTTASRSYRTTMVASRISAPVLRVSAPVLRASAAPATHHGRRTHH